MLLNRPNYHYTTSVHILRRNKSKCLTVDALKVSVSQTDSNYIQLGDRTTLHHTEWRAGRDNNNDNNSTEEKQRIGQHSEYL